MCEAPYFLAHVDYFIEPCDAHIFSGKSDIRNGDVFNFLE